MTKCLRKRANLYNNIADGILLECDDLIVVNISHIFIQISGALILNMLLKKQFFGIFSGYLRITAFWGSEIFTQKCMTLRGFDNFFFFP